MIRRKNQGLVPETKTRDTHISYNSVGLKKKLLLKPVYETVENAEESFIWAVWYVVVMVIMYFKAESSPDPYNEILIKKRHKLYYEISQTNIEWWNGWYEICPEGIF